MDERRKKAEKPTGTKQKTLGDKLKNETSSGEAMRKKLRHGKADNTLTREEAKKLQKVKKQGRRKMYAETVVSAQVHHKISQQEDENVGTESLNRGTQATEVAIQKVKQNHYSNKLHEKKVQERATEDASKKASSSSSNKASRELQKKRVRKEMESAAQKKTVRDNANRFGNLSKKFVDKAEELTGMLAEYLAENPTVILWIALISLILIIVIGGLSSCSMMGAGVGNVTVATSFTAEDSEILAVEQDYKQLESDLRATIAGVPASHPGYDEYRYTLAEIGHNHFQLAAVLTVLYEDYTRAEVQAMIQSIYEAQYTLTFQEIVEVRTRTETRTGHRTIHHEDGTTSTESYTYEVEVEYNYYILQTTLTNNTLDTVIRGLGLTTDQMQRYELLLETYGNKPGIFGDDIYSEVNPGEYQDYDIPPEALTDQRFAKMIQVAERYLGYPYVWGGSSPSTSFDCSGYVSYVINNCGNGWSMGRQTANGLLGHCTRVSRADAKPGDLIFFQGTYEVRGASHVGIYVGNGMMIHCGNPIQYASINTTYWQNHFLTFGRIN